MNQTDSNNLKVIKIIESFRSSTFCSVRVASRLALLSCSQADDSMQGTGSDPEISEADEFVVSVWQRINDPLHMSLEALGLENVPITDIASDVKDMRTILDEEIPRLRRLASADHFGNRI